MRAKADELGLALFCHAGDPLGRSDLLPSDAELDLAGSCAELERELQAAEWAAPERLLLHIDEDRIIVPRDPIERNRLVADIFTLGWTRRRPTLD